MEPNPAGFSVSARAAARLAEIAAAQAEGSALRVAVLAGGCSGFQYKFELDNEVQPDDLVLERDGARVLVDPTSLDLLGGGELDYTDELMGSHFTVRNPQAKSSCGCGTSFFARLKIATWNVNSIRQRVGHVKRWLERVQPDILVLQEIKCEAPQFPGAEFAAVGYQSEVVGQKSYNGVAVLARVPFTVTHRALPGLPAEDAQSRYVEIEAGGVAIGGLYLPNGNSGGEAGYAYKLAWMDRLVDRAEALLADDRPAVLLGDYNVCPADIDFFPGTLAPNDALLRPETRARFNALVWAGMTDAIRAVQPNGPVYTFWDYQAGCWPRDRGLRIDHAMLSPALAERLVSAAPDRHQRGEEQPSDHVPVLVEISE